MDDYYARYASIGFMCGLEIHQRLATAQKLFCACPTNIIASGGGREGRVVRYQRAVAGELGSVDRSAEFEEGRNRKFVYLVPERHACLVEIDEEPPHEMNRDALLIAASFARSMGMRLVDEIQPMRKEVVDGSDPSAFQRTAMVAYSGSIEVNGKRVEIPSLFLEEESSSIESGGADEITYGVERLGVPLVEIDTDPFIRSPKDAKDIALHIGTLLRISGKVQRGIGSIRQDVNVSIKGGARVEIKGLQDIEAVDTFIENEVRRQEELLRIMEELKGRKASVSVPSDLTELLKKSGAGLIRKNIESGGAVFGLRLRGFGGLVGKEINPGRRLGTEISDYARAAGVGGIMHSDENLEKYGLTKKETAEISAALGAAEGDAFILVAGRRENALRAATLSAGRAEKAIEGVPVETRGVVPDGSCTTRFLRPLPGGSRMYPETDARPIVVTREMAEQADEAAPDLQKEEKEILKEIPNRDIAVQMLTSPKLWLYKKVAAATGADREFITNVLIQKFKELKREGLDVDSIREDRLEELFRMYGKGSLTKQAVHEAVAHLARKDSDVDELVKRNGLQRISGKKLSDIIRAARAEGTGGREQLIMKIMSKYRLNVDGAELNSLL